MDLLALMAMAIFFIVLFGFLILVEETEPRDDNGEPIYDEQ